MIAIAALAVIVTNMVPASAWDYSRNGADWSGMGVCGQEGQQSPVDLPASAPIAEEELTMFLKYPELNHAVTVYHNGNSIALTLPNSFRGGFGLGKAGDNPKEFQSEDKDAYRLWQVNFHSPSEHTINGQRLPLEMQMMHQQVTGGEGLAVVVVRFHSVANDYNNLLDAIIGRSLPRKPWQEALRNPPLEFASVVGGSDFYMYEGSLTVPPCEQKVKYFVRKDTVAAAHNQLMAFDKILKETCLPKGNYRQLQKLTGSVQLVGSVDLVTAPDKMVPASKAHLPEEKTVVNVAVVGGCTPEEKEEALNAIARIRVGESKELSEAKTRARAAERDLQYAQRMLADSSKSVKEGQKQYDAGGGPVQKIHLKWDVKTAETKAADAARDRPAKARLAKETYEEVVRMIMKECADKHRAEALKKALKAKKAPLISAARVGDQKQKATRHYNYPKPLVKLPLGLAGSPFSNKEADGEKVVLHGKIAANLRESDLPPSGKTEEAVGVDAAVKHDGIPERMMAFKLPAVIPAGNASAFKRDLVKAFAKISRVSENRLEVKETRDVAVQKVQLPTQAQVATVLDR